MEASAVQQRDAAKEELNNSSNSVRREMHFQRDAAEEAADAETSATKAAAEAHDARVAEDNKSLAVVNSGNILVSTFKAAEEKIEHREA